MTVALESQELESMFRVKLPCEAGHDQINNAICSGEAVARHRVLCNEGSAFVCANHVRWVHWFQEIGGTCLLCGNTSGEDWKVQPI